MVTITCKYSGIKFEAKTRRSNTHPQIADMRKVASKRGNWREVDAAIDVTRKAGTATTIEAFVEAVETIIRAEREADNARAEAVKAAAVKAAAAKAAAEAAKAERAAKLKAAGYNWHRQDIGDTEVSQYVWVLFSPDGRPVSEEEALDEIERGIETVKAEGNAAAAAKDAEEKAAAAKAAAAKAAFEKVRTEAESHAEVEKIDYNIVKTFDVLARHNGYLVRKGLVNGVICYNVKFSDFDETRNWYYSADPVAAGLTPKATEQASPTFLGLRRREADDDNYF